MGGFNQQGFGAGGFGGDSSDSGGLSTGSPLVVISGQALLDLLDDRLGGYANAKQPDEKLRFLNEAKDEVWVVLKALNSDYFGQMTQTTDSTLMNYFPALSRTARNYSLPDDFRDMRFIECNTSGYEYLKFRFCDMTDPEFQAARKGSTADGPSNGDQGEYLYTIWGKNTFLLANYPTAALSLTIYYIRALPDFESGDEIDQILAPYGKKIADFAAQKILLSLQDEVMTEEYKQQWRSDVVTLQVGAGPRNQADAVFAQDFYGG